MSRTWRRFLTVSAVVLVGIQFVPVARSNPPVEETVPAPAEVHAILRRACMDCHSHETVWPWYARIAPVSWLLARDVREAREHVNFSQWNRLTPNERREHAEDIWEEVARGSMPLGIYVLMHSEAHLTDDDKKQIEVWTKTLGH